MATVVNTLIDGLRRRGTPVRAATLAARTAVIAFTVAWDDCVEHPDEDFGDFMRRAIADLRTVVGEQ